MVIVLTKRIIPCLDIKDGRVVKGINFENFNDAGNPVELAKYYNNQGADELSILDITASYEKRDIIYDIVEKVANEVFIPLSVGGGIKSLDEIRKLLSLGAEKVSLGSSAVQDPSLIKKASEEFGTQAIVTSLDVKKNHFMKNGWEVYIHGGRTATGLDALNFAQRMERFGTGEILLNSIDSDGTQQGFDLTLNRLFSETLNIPIIASGGAGSVEDIYNVFTAGKADAALAASIFHYHKITIKEVKTFLKEKNIEVRI
ncbi:Imidazole glycerol phosphate synthase subunit HisF [Candidatus Lokiarchaeum ossiferum]|uniref:Imidazole glycerol phosphate synthase subunit HisF n=1 Tax=Candidatus Lokiarchaeum ossiferum TaxID=2951803 RepID=A0ABY6HW67_9ARCH|nr:Imidazole glycerol phosphate synthase subunit HisF [Candidatus Lokiarchaeum sp. B-35]